LDGRLGPDPENNVHLVRAALRQAAQALTAEHPVVDMKRRLLQWAIDADIVLDLHCDAESAVHLYGLTPQAALCVELGALLGARAILMATESGDSPFDEACSRPWLQVQQRHPDSPVPLACFSTTVELRGEADTDHELARQDAQALVEFLRRRGIVSGTPAPLPIALCEPTPLASSEPVTAPCAGVLVFSKRPGQHVAAGEHIADIVDIESGQLHAIHAQSDGVLYARIATRWARAGQRVAKVAGISLQRSGRLLSA
jgi:predicted deacylase